MDCQVEGSLVCEASPLCLTPWSSIGDLQVCCCFLTYCEIYHCVSVQNNINENEVEQFLKILPVYRSKLLNIKQKDHQDLPNIGFSKTGSAMLLSSRNKESPQDTALNLCCPRLLCSVGQVVHCTVGLAERVRKAEVHPTCSACQGTCPGPWQHPLEGRIACS